jgi:hypothetical protein
MFEFAGATTGVLTEMSKVVWLQSKFNDPMKTQLSLKSLTEEGTRVPKPPT